ncbi:S8 family serine peptidase [Flammeovirga sp. MY04]|uniref:S8 family peptidase n=1 Tax=Flammeovirga sp. MY04 TaxID=1191459 RepID=UPI000806289F|nr:S8 family peptidase [Flammeovirga sp. MY04]ANQ47728.1 S8 family serine peptidase [Flammeovirga sp. MY04]
MKPFFIILFLSLVFELQAQETFYLVSFKNKDNTTHALDRPEEYLSAEAIARRTKYSIAIDSTDLPVPQANIDEVETTGAKIWYPSKWFNAVIVSEADSTAIAQLSIVDKVMNMSDKTNGGIERSEEIEWKRSNVNNQIQNELIGIDHMHEMGYKGNGISIAVLDAGFSNYNNITYFSETDIIDTYDFYSKNATVEDDHHHGTEVMSTMAAVGDDYLGGTPEASYALYRTENVAYESRIEELMWLIASERADSLGVDIIQSSLGYYDFDDVSQNYTHDDLDGRRAWITMAANHAFTKGICVVVSAGNEGLTSWKRITFPADSPFVLTVGSVDKNEVKAESSSIGPTADSRIKPDIMALGKACYVVGTSSNVKTSNGTSFAAPQMASFVAGLLQSDANLTPSQIFQKIRNSGSRSTDITNDYGYGTANFEKSLTVTSIHDVNLLGDLKVYPNPVNGERFQMEVPQKVVGKTLDIIWYDMSGRKLDKNKLHQVEKVTILNVPKKAQGNYLLLKVSADKETKTIKVKVN